MDFYGFRADGNCADRGSWDRISVLGSRYAVGTANGAMAGGLRALYGQSDPCDRLWGVHPISRVPPAGQVAEVSWR
jgi:hypothetical protein